MTSEHIDRLKELLKLSGEKLNRVEKDLDKNWVAQIVLVVLSLTLIFHVGNIATAVSELAFRSRDFANALDLLIPFVLFYLFMRFGYLLTIFIHTHRMHRKLLQEYIGDDFSKVSKVDLKELLQTSSFFEPYGNVELFRGNHSVFMVAVYYAFAPILLAMAHASSLYLLLRAPLLKGGLGWLLAAVLLGGLVILYLSFHAMNKEHPHIRWSLVVILLGTALLMAFFNYAT